MKVFVLTLTSWDVEDPGPVQTEVVGVYRNMDDVRADQAARYSGCVERYGTIHLDWQWSVEEIWMSKQ